MTRHTANRLNLLIIGPPSFVDEATRAFWLHHRIHLMGPHAADLLEQLTLDCAIDGAVIDIGYDADTLLHCIETLDKQRIPAVFASAALSSIQLSGGFVLSRDRDDLDALVGQLLGQKNTTLH